MKVFVAAAVLAFVASTIAVPVSDEHKEEYKKMTKECVAETGIEEEFVKKAEHDGVFPEDSKLPDFYACISKRTGFLNEAGEYQIEVMTKKLNEIYGEENTKKLLSVCAKEKYGSLKEAALKMAKCFYDHSPEHKDEPKKE